MKSQQTIIDKLSDELYSAAMALEEAACTCVKRDNGHQRSCMGVDMARDYLKMANKYRSATPSSRQ